jgi:hypothetical protein
MHIHLNREKMVFLGSLLGLGMACSWALARRPSVTDPGAHRVRLSAPAGFEVTLPAPGHLDTSGGRNPFDPWRASRSGGRRTERTAERGTVADRDEEVDAGEALRGLRAFTRRRQAAKERQASHGGTARIWEIPARFRGVLRPIGGRWRVILEEKGGAETRSLFVGEVWPDLNLRILRITSDSVLLENERGKRFLMPDLYRSRAEGGRGDSAQAEPRD